MKIENVIEAFNVSIKNKRLEAGNLSNSFLILHKSVVPHDKFKAYKVFNYSVWCYYNSAKFKIIELDKTYRAISEQEINEILDSMDAELCRHFLEWSLVHYDDILTDNISGL